MVIIWLYSLRKRTISGHIFKENREQLGITAPKTYAGDIKTFSNFKAGSTRHICKYCKTYKLIEYKTRLKIKRVKYIPTVNVIRKPKDKMTLNKKIDIAINSIILTACILSIITTVNHRTGNWVTPVVTLVLLIGLAVIQSCFLLLSIFHNKSKPLNWTLLFPIIILLCSIYLTVHFIKVCPSPV